ncbi:hypothetical protein GCM10029976_099950 [Kribbella albertanoniae]
MKIIEARLNALTNHQTKSLKLKPVALPKVASQLPDELGYYWPGGQICRRRTGRSVIVSAIDAAKAAFYPDINLMAFLQQDALHLSDLFHHSAQQMGVTAGLTLPISIVVVLTPTSISQKPKATCLSPATTKRWLKR